MFGLLKENIVSDLELKYNNGNNDEFVENFNEFVNTVTKSRALSELYETYNMVSTSRFENELLAIEFINECLDKLKLIDKSDLKLLEGFTVSTPNNTYLKGVDYYLDQIVFNDKLNIKEKIEFKGELVNILTKKVDLEGFKDDLDTLNESIESAISLLSEDEIKILDLFLEYDETKVNDYYTNLLNETTELVDNKIISSEDTNLIKKLVEAKKKLISLKKESATVPIIEEVLNLKKSL